MPTPSVIQIRIPGRVGAKGLKGDKGDVGDVNPEMLVIQEAAEDARDLSQAWAEGTIPGGSETKSSREWSIESAGHAEASRLWSVAAEQIVSGEASGIIYGAGQPTDDIGADGQSYVDTTNDRLFGPKTAGLWPETYREFASSGSVTYYDATVAFFMGQSNAKGFSLDPSGTTSLTPGNGFEFYASTATNGLLLPLGRNRLGRTQGGPQPAFCETWAPNGGGPVICVDIAAGGSSMVSAAKTTLTGTSFLPALSGGTWDQSDAANIYTNYFKPLMDSALAKVRAAGFRIRHQVVYWSQGEQDALGNVTQAAYEAAFRAFLTQLKSDFPDIVVLIEALGRNQGGTDSDYAVVNAAQTAVAADPAYSDYVTIACDLAKDFASGDFSDSLHYNQASYNTLGAAVATAGLTFVGSPSWTVDTTYYDALVADLPAIPGWKRIEVDTSKSGTWDVSFFSDPITPYATTWYDGAAENMGRADQTCTFTYADTSAKTIFGYVSDTIGSSGAFNGSANTAATALRFPDSGIKLMNINFGTAGACAANFTCAEADILRLDGATIRIIGFVPTTSTRTNFTATDAMLTHLTGLTNINIPRSQTPTLNPTLYPALKTYTLTSVGFSQAQVNQFLVDLDANGLSAGAVSIGQYSAALSMASAVPSGAGATAKTSLQGKGWSVTTD